MEEEILSIIAEESGERIDALLARTLEGLSRSAAQRLLEEDRVTREEDGKALRKSDRVQAGEHITVVLPELAEDRPLSPQDLPLDVVYEDDDLIFFTNTRLNCP